MAHDFEDYELSESSSFLPYNSDFVHPCDGKSKRLHGIWKALQGFFWLFTVMINLCAVVVLTHFINGRPDFGGEVNNITPRFSKELIKFEPAFETYSTNLSSSSELADVRQRWQDLLPNPEGGGDVHIPNHERYSQLSEPFLDSHGNTLWKVSWAHQIHCLYYVLDAYDRVVRYGPTGHENEVEEGHHSVHTKHCFDYLRQAILCNADMTLEGRTVFDNTGGTDGFGHTHVCRNRHEVIQWAEAHRVKDKGFIIDPDSPL